MRKNMAYILILLAAIMWGTLGVFTKNLTSLGFSTVDLLFVRAVVTFLVAFITYSIKYSSELKLKKFSDIKYFIGTGIFSYLFFNMCYMNAIIETSMGVAAILLYTAPAIVMIISVILFNEKITYKKIIIVAVTFGGCCMVTGIGGGSSVSLKGIILGLCSGLGYALYSIFGKFAIKRGYSSAVITTYTFLFVAIGILPFTDVFSLVNHINQEGVWLQFIFSSILTGALPYFAYTKGLTSVPASSASVMASLEPVVASVLGIVVFSESLSFMKIGGICLVMAGVFASAKN